MRRKDREIQDQSDLINFLGSQHVGTLSMIAEDGPYGVPLNYIYDEGHLYFHCALAGKKLTALSKDGRVCFSVVEAGPQALWKVRCGITQIYKSVMCFGVAKVITACDVKMNILNKMVQKYVPLKYNYSVTQDGFFNHTAIIKMRIEKMTGKQNNLTADHTIIERD